MNIIIFCDTVSSVEEVSNDLLFGICDHVACRTKHYRTVFEIDEKNIVIDIRPADIFKSAGLRPDYVLFYSASSDFIDHWKYNMGGRYTELKTLDELIQLVIKED